MSELTITQKRERNCRNKSHELDDVKKYQLVLTYTKKCLQVQVGHINIIETKCQNYLSGLNWRRRGSLYMRNTPEAKEKKTKTISSCQEMINY